EEGGVEPLAYTPRIDACLSGDFTYLVAEDLNGSILVREIHTETGQIVRDYEIGQIDNKPVYKPRVAPHGSGVRVYFLNQSKLWFADISGGSVSSNTLVGGVGLDTEYDVLPGGVCAYCYYKGAGEGYAVAVYDNGVVYERDSLPVASHGVALPVGWASSTSWLVVVYGRDTDDDTQVIGTLQLGASDRAYAEFDDFPTLDDTFDIRGFRIESVGACLGPDDTVFVTVHHPNVSSTGDAGGQFTEPAPWTRLYQVAIDDGAPVVGWGTRRCHRVRPVSKPWYDAERETVHFMAAHASGARFEVTDDNRYFVVLQSEYGAGDTGVYPMAHFAQERAEPCLQSNASDLQQPNVQPCTPLIDDEGNVALIGLEREPGVEI